MSLFFMQQERLERELSATEREVASAQGRAEALADVLARHRALDGRLATKLAETEPKANVARRAAADALLLADSGDAAAEKAKARLQSEARSLRDDVTTVTDARRQLKATMDQASADLVEARVAYVKARLKAVHIRRSVASWVVAGLAKRMREAVAEIGDLEAERFRLGGTVSLQQSSPGLQALTALAMCNGGTAHTMGPFGGDLGSPPSYRVEDWPEWEETRAFDPGTYQAADKPIRERIASGSPHVALPVGAGDPAEAA